MSGPSSHASPSQRRSAMMLASSAASERAASVSSMRSTKLPPVWRAKRKL